jgi:hypothetical protein
MELEWHRGQLVNRAAAELFCFMKRPLSLEFDELQNQPWARLPQSAIGGFHQGQVPAGKRCMGRQKLWIPDVASNGLPHVHRFAVPTTRFILVDDTVVDQAIHF